MKTRTQINPSILAALLGVVFTAELPGQTAFMNTRINSSILAVEKVALRVRLEKLEQLVHSLAY